MHSRNLIRVHVYSSGFSRWKEQVFFSKHKLSQRSSLFLCDGKKEEEKKGKSLSVFHFFSLRRAKRKS